MSRFCVVVLFILFALIGCDKVDPHPEFKDPIYHDLKTKAETHQKSIDEGKKKLEELKIALTKTEANSIEQKDLRLQIAKTEKNLLQDSQWARYYKIRADRRVVSDKIMAREALTEKRPWPDPREYSDYLVNKRLREVPMNWNARVPRLQDRLVKHGKKDEASEEPTSASAGGH